MTGVEFLIAALASAAIGSTIKQGIGAMQGRGVEPGNWFQDMFKALPLAATGAGVAGALGGSAITGIGEAGSEVVGHSVLDMISPDQFGMLTAGMPSAATAGAGVGAAAELPVAMPTMTEQVFGTSIPGLKGAQTATNVFGPLATSPQDFPHSTYLRGDLAFGGAMRPTAGPSGPMDNRRPPSYGNPNRWGTGQYNYSM